MWSRVRAQGNPAGRQELKSAVENFVVANGTMVGAKGCTRALPVMLLMIKEWEAVMVQVFGVGLLALLRVDH